MSEGRSKDHRYWLPRLATAIFVPALLLVFLEGALTLFGVGTPTGATRPCYVGNTIATCDNYFFTRAFFPAGMLRTPRPYSIAERKPKGTYRIVVLGESAAYGDPDPAYAFSRYLQIMLRQRFPRANFEVINTGITAINSHVIVPIARDLAQHQPDLFIVYAGNNEVVGPFGPGTVFTSSAMSRPAIRASIFIRTTRTGQLIDSLLTPKSKQQQAWRGMEMFLSRQVRADSAATRSVYGNFEANLRQIIDSAQKAGAPVLLSTVATNLRDCGPFASAHRDGISAEESRAWAALIDQAKAEEIAGRHTEAARLYQSAVEIDPSYAETEFLLARALWASGDRAAARDHFLKAQDLDTLRFRTDSKLNDVIRSVAASSKDAATLVDSAALLADKSEGGITGSEFFFEHVHLTPRGNYELALAMLPQVIDRLPADLKGTELRDVPSEEECNRLLALTSYDRVRIAQSMAERMKKPPFVNQVNHDEMIAKVLSGSDTDILTDAATAQQYVWAIRQNPADGLLHLNYGLFLGHVDRSAALEELRLSRPYHDMPFVAPDGTVIR